MSELLKTSILPKTHEQTEEEKWNSLQRILGWEPIVTLINLAGKFCERGNNFNPPLFEE